MVHVGMRRGGGPVGEACDSRGRRAVHRGRTEAFADQLRVDARDIDSVQAFVKALLSTTYFFARRDEPMTEFAPEGSEVRDFAAEPMAPSPMSFPQGPVRNGVRLRRRS